MGTTISRNDGRQRQQGFRGDAKFPRHDAQGENTQETPFGANFCVAKYMYFICVQSATQTKCTPKSVMFDALKVQQSGSARCFHNICVQSSARKMDLGDKIEERCTLCENAERMHSGQTTKGHCVPRMQKQGCAGENQVQQESAFGFGYTQDMWKR